MRDVLTGLVRRTGWTEGDAWTVALGMGLALSLAVSTIPAVLEHRDSPTLGAQPQVTPAPPRVPVVVPSPTPPTPVPPPLVPPPVLGPPSAPSPDRPSPTAAPPRRVPVVLRGLLSTFAVVPGPAAPGGLAVAADGSVSVGTDAPAGQGGPSELLGWDPAGRLRLTTAVPGQPTDRARGLTAVDHSPDGALVAADAATGRVLRHHAGRWSVLGTLPDLPICLGPLVTPCQPGLTDTAPLPRGLAVDTRGDVLVADAGQGTIWRLPLGAPAETWYQSEDLLGADALGGLAVEASGAVLAVVTRLAGLSAAGDGALIRIARTATGAAGTRSTVTAFPAGDDPVDVAVGARTYVALRGVDAVVELDREGSEGLRFTGDGLRAPTAVAVSGGRLLLTSTGPRNAVLQIGVESGRTT